jgi:hypothetical protein
VPPPACLFLQNAWGPEQDLALEGTSCFLLGPRNPLRLALHRVISHSWFEGVLIVCILISSLTLALDSPNLAPDSKLKRALDVSALCLGTPAPQLTAVIPAVVPRLSAHMQVVPQLWCR